MQEEGRTTVTRHTNGQINEVQGEYYIKITLKFKKFTNCNTNLQTFSRESTIIILNRYDICVIIMKKKSTTIQCKKHLQTTITERMNDEGACMRELQKFIGTFLAQTQFKDTFYFRKLSAHSYL